MFRSLPLAVCLMLAAVVLVPPAQAQQASREREAERSSGWRSLGKELQRELGGGARREPPAGSWDAELRKSLRDGRADPEARRAADRAVARHGGRVLSVVPAGEGYRVRLLLDSGRVITTTVEG